MNKSNQVFAIIAGEIWNDVIGVCSTLEIAKRRCQEYIQAKINNGDLPPRIEHSESETDETSDYQYWTEEDGEFLRITPWELDLPLPGAEEKP